jgi:4-aminobutyrate aminotransferase-like enzyme
MIYSWNQAGKNVAALVVEPIQAEGGNYVLSFKSLCSFGACFTSYSVSLTNVEVYHGIVP